MIHGESERGRGKSRRAGSKVALGGMMLGAVWCVAACSSHSIQLTAEQKVVQGQLSTIEPKRDPLVAKTPVIDIHTHTFNARYLPLRSILLGKRDAARR
jgi:hypothetical protein